MNSSQKIKNAIGLALEKGLGGDRVKCSLRNGTKKLPKPCGAEVYALNAGEMECRESE